MLSVLADPAGAADVDGDRRGGRRSCRRSRSPQQRQPELVVVVVEGVVVADLAGEVVEIGDAVASDGTRRRRWKIG